MFQFSKKDSEHVNLYNNKNHENLVHSIDPSTTQSIRLHNSSYVHEDEALTENGKDDLYKFKRYISPKKSYEVYLQIEKAQQQYKLEMAKKMDSMEQLANKIRKG